MAQIYRNMLSSIALLMTLISASSAYADDAPAPIRQFDIPTIEKLGAEMYAQDQDAWKATDVLTAQYSVDQLKAEKVHGWIVDARGDFVVVRFIHEGASGAEIFCNVSFAQSFNPRCTNPQDRTLDPDELAQYNARTLALKNVDRPCGDNFNTVVLKDPQGDGWIVWVLAATTNPKAKVLAGHYRFTISKSGTTVVQKDALSHSCLISEGPGMPQGSTLTGLSVAHFVSLQPVETQVFASLSYKLPLYVGTLDGKTWKVDGTTITEVEDDSPGMDGLSARSFAGHEELCKTLLTKSIDGTPKFFIGGDVKVIEATEKADKFSVDVPDGASAISVACGRKNIVPAPNDYKVLLGGLALTIFDRGAGHPNREATLEMKDGRVIFTIEKGDPLTADVSAKVNARLSAFRSALGAAH